MITHRVCRPGDCWLRSQCQLHSHCSPAGGRCPTSVPQPGAAAEPAAGAWLQAPPPGELTAQRSKGTARATSWCCNAIVNSVGWATCSIVVLAWTASAGQQAPVRLVRCIRVCQASLQQGNCSKAVALHKFALQLQTTPFSPRWVDGPARRLTAWDNSRAGLSSALGGIIGDVESYINSHAGAATFRPPFLPPRWVLVPAEQLISACSQCVLQLAGLHSAT